VADDDNLRQNEESFLLEVRPSSPNDEILPISIAKVYYWPQNNHPEFTFSTFTKRKT
jgi:hypothetical protein